MRTFYCTKCDHDKVRVKYTIIDPSKISRAADFIKGSSQHLSCRCERCGFKWYEDVSSSEESENK